jgi:hypothetical protein
MLQQKQRVALLLRHFEVRKKRVEGSLGLNIWVLAFEGADEN